MSADDKDQHPTSEEDAFYEAGYEEDTIDYDLDADELLEEETFERPMATHRDDLEADSESLPEQQGEFEQELEYDLEPEESDEQYSEPWPLALIAVAVIALLLMAAGGYGIIQQRGTMEEEIRQLRAELATTASNQELAASRQAQRALGLDNEQLQSQLDQLQQENQELLVAAAQTAATPGAQVEPRAQPPAIKKISPVPAAPAGAGWFVNFGSYKVEATASKWASRLHTDEGRIVVIAGDKENTRYYRVRIINLPSRAIAEKIARELEQAHRLPSLWIGKQ